MSKQIPLTKQQKNLQRIIDAMVQREGIPADKVHDMEVTPMNIRMEVRQGNGVESVCLADYRYFDGIDYPLFLWKHPSVAEYIGQRILTQPNGFLKADFRLNYTHHNTLGFIISGENASPLIHTAIMRMLTNWTNDPRYDLTKDAGAFFQGGSNDRNGKWFYVEFWKPEGAQAWMDQFNLDVTAMLNNPEEDAGGE